MAPTAPPRAGVADSWQQWPNATVGGQAARSCGEKAWAGCVVGASAAEGQAWVWQTDMVACQRLRASPEPLAGFAIFDICSMVQKGILRLLSFLLLSDFPCINRPIVKALGNRQPQQTTPSPAFPSAFSLQPHSQDRLSFLV